MATIGGRCSTYRVSASPRIWLEARPTRASGIGRTAWAKPSGNRDELFGEDLSHALGSRRVRHACPEQSGERLVAVPALQEVAGRRGADLIPRKRGEVRQAQVELGGRREEPFLIAVVAHHHRRVDLGVRGDGPDCGALVAVVVGAGPVGLATAATLAARGADVTVVDQQAEGVNTSRAAVVHARTLEVLDAIGAAGPLVAQGIHAPRFTIRDRDRDRDRTLVPVRFDDLPTPYPYALMVPQSVTEAVLLDRLTALGGRVLRPYTVVGLDGDVVTFAGGETLRARYVVGADGMRSAVRSLAGIGFGADDDGESFTLADIRVNSDLPHDEVILFFSRAGMLVWAPLPDGSIRLVAQVDDAPEHPTPDYLQRLLDTRGAAADPVVVTEVVWGSRFRVHHRVADRFRAGAVLLAGDAGHVHSPAGGQGMNLGLQDAVALGNALAAVLAGAPESTLDDYAAARRPVAHEVVQFAKRLTRLATVVGPLRPVRNGVLGALSWVPAFRRRLAWRLSGLVYR